MKDKSSAERTVKLPLHPDSDIKVGRRGLLTAIFFFVLVFFLVAIALFFRLVEFLSDSAFDGAHQFTIVVAGKEKGTPLHILSFSPETTSITLLRIPKKIADTLQHAPSAAQRFLLIPVTSSLVLESVPDQMHESDVAQMLKNAAFSARYAQTDIHPSDLYKLWWYSINVPPGNIQAEEVVTTEGEQAMDQQMVRLFGETTLITENKSMTIINATGVPGIGNRLARMLSNMGGTIVLVTTAKDLQRRSEIRYSGEISYTVTRLAGLLHFPITPDTDRGIADIVITIGREGLERIAL